MISRQHIGFRLLKNRLAYTNFNTGTNMISSSQQRTFKIEIGSGTNPQPGYIHLDCRFGLPELGVISDIRTALPFRENSIDEILSHSSIEHVSWRSIRETLSDWFRVLKPGGRVIIYTPDFRYLCEMYLQGKTDEHLDKSYIEESKKIFGTYTPAVWAMIKMFAGQEYPENFHYASYDFDLLRSVLETVGFRQVTRIAPMYSLRIKAVKPINAVSVSVPETVQKPDITSVPPAAPIYNNQPVFSSAQTSGRKGLVHVNLIDRGWILERMGMELERHLDYVSVGDSPDPDAMINYHINYHAFKKKHSLDMALFTHIEENVPPVKELFFTVARLIDYCVCMSKKYELILHDNKIEHVTTIMPGVELEKFKPVLRIGVVGRTYHTGRKGEQLVAKAMAIPHTQWYFAGDGWPRGGIHFPYEKLTEFYQLIDCLLVPALYEGGPMPFLEALASGKPVISPPVGFVPEFPHIEYEAGNFEELRNRIDILVEEKLALRRTVEHQTWLRWAMEHHRLFSKYLPAENITTLKMPGVIQQTPAPVLQSVPEFAGTSVYGINKLRILLVARKEQLTGGPSIRIPILQKLMSAMGHTVDICYDQLPDSSEYDVAHVFNVWAPWEAMQQMRHLKKYKTPVVLSPIFLDLAESAWAAKAVMLIFAPDVDAAARDNYLTALANGSLMLDNRSRAQGLEIFPGANNMLREIILLSDYVVTLSTEEMQRISKCLSIYNHPFTVVRNSADYSAFENGSSQWFVSTYGIKNFVLCVGRIERRKNQVMLLHAMRDSGLPVVMIGQNGEPDYEQICRSLAPKDTLFIPQLGREELASAFAAARVCVQPSWCEGASLVNLEAAASGCPLVISNRASEFEYFGDSVRYCDPADWRSIAQAVHDAYLSYDTEKEQREKLRKRLKVSCTWELAAEATLAAYEKVIARKDRTIQNMQRV